MIVKRMLGVTDDIKHKGLYEEISIGDIVKVRLKGDVGVTGRVIQIEELTATLDVSTKYHSEAKIISYSKIEDIEILGGAV